MFHWKLSMLTAAVKRDGVNQGCKLECSSSGSERGRETEEREKERQYVFRTGWLTVGFWGRYQRVLHQKRGRERERGVDESFCNLCATDDFPSALFTHTLLFGDPLGCDSKSERRWFKDSPGRTQWNRMRAGCHINKWNWGTMSHKAWLLQFWPLQI